MDRGLIEAAIEKAIRGGAVVARPIPLISPDSEINLVRARTDVDVEPQALDDFVVNLHRDPQMKRLNSAFTTVPTGGGASTNLNSIGRLLLARALASGDVRGTVENFCNYVEKNAAPMKAAMAVSGVRTAGEIRLGSDVQLVPITSLPPSLPRGEALGQPIFPKSVVPPDRRAVSAALVTGLDFGPIFYWPYEGGRPSETAHERVRSAWQLLDEARTLLSLLGINAAMRIFWIFPEDPLMGTGTEAGWLTNREFVDPEEDVEADVEEAEGLAAAYFRMDHARRQETLHIPISRLDRAVRGNDLVDRAVDLGIALEALLLHGLNDQTELKFRLSLRGAWLCGKNATERAEIQEILGEVYKLRSKAVHTGKIGRTEKNQDTLERGVGLCKRLIRKMIDEGGWVNWDTLVLGGSAGRI
jgi:hypothetical protein